VYRFVSARAVDRDDPARNRDLLDEGVLYAARFDADGTGRWLPLVHGQGGLVEANGFRSQADVLIEAREAATRVGATPMDRPEDVEANPATGRVYVVLTKNKARPAARVDAANPRAENLYGHILELIPTPVDGRPDPTADAFTWNVFLRAGDPARPADGAAYGPGMAAAQWLANPDNIAFDPRGRLWIATDGADDFDVPDGVYVCDTDGPARAAPRMLYAAPTRAEVCGPCFTPDGTTLFVAVQHPGEGSPFAFPSTRWPDFRRDMPPRPSVVAIRREDGGPVGG
jgi:secreted PhoX family phosphatase